MRSLSQPLRSHLPDRRHRSRNRSGDRRCVIVRSALEIGVEVDNGVAVLAGTVDNLKAKLAAAQDASNTMGVWQVENNIDVEPETRPSDAEISQNIEASLRRDPYLEVGEIDVSVNDGIVTLNGLVDSYFEKWEAGDLAALSKGVVAVVNEIEVDYELLSYDTYFYQKKWV
ncbi:Osmotically inducible protein Y precursor [Geitlerinema sp. FC II]|nr:BON domain-containing protein [Geitlerinema sp. CS-897]PPT11219.1 Osmotically inducible protein Y precursor [Geitlerinema sp. FC II]